MTSTFWATILRAALLLTSFVGLCAAIRVRFKLDKFTPPYLACSAIIVTLMLCGMLGALKWGVYALYLLGFAGLAYAYLIRRARPEFGLIALLLAFSALLAWRFYPCPLSANDDVSHWGLVARHLLRYDSFPDGSANYVFFQSYPLGAASFIYYVGRAVGNSEGLYLVAQNFLFGALFLPVLGCIRENRRYCYPVVAALFVFLFHYTRYMLVLQVDLLLAFFGIGMVAAIAVHRDDLKRALIAGVPGMIAVVYVKNSGMFFAFIAALCLALVAQRRRGRRSDGWIAACACIAGFALAYLLWILHIRLRFPAALETKHAVSLAAYAAQASSKGMHTILRILKRLAQAYLDVTSAKVYALAFMACAAILLLLGCRLPGQQGLRRPVVRALIACVGAYVLWSVLLCCMYIFSMPEREAIVAASFYRYNGTGLAYMMGLTSIVLFSFFGRREAAQLRPFRWLRPASAAFLLGIVLVYALPNQTLLERTTERTTEYSPIRRELIAAHRQYDLPDGGSYLIFCHEEDLEVGPYNQFYHVKYEFETANILIIAENDGQYLMGTSRDLVRSDDPTEYLSRNLDGKDALLILDACPNFEAALSAYLEAHPSDTPVIRACDLV